MAGPCELSIVLVWEELRGEVEGEDGGQGEWRALPVCPRIRQAMTSVIERSTSFEELELWDADADSPARFFVVCLARPLQDGGSAKKTAKNGFKVLILEDPSCRVRAGSLAPFAGHGFRRRRFLNDSAPDPWRCGDTARQSIWLRGRRQNRY